MMFASIQSEINQILGVFGFLFGLAMGILFMIARLVGRHVKKGYEEEGGAKGLTKKVVTKGVGEILKRAILKKR